MMRKMRVRLNIFLTKRTILALERQLNAACTPAQKAYCKMKLGMLKWELEILGAAK